MRSRGTGPTIKVDDRDTLAAALKSQGIPTAVYYPNTLDRQAAYSSCPVAPGGVPELVRLTERVLSLPMHPYLDEAIQARIVDAVRRALD